MKKFNILLLISVMFVMGTSFAHAFDWGSVLGGMLNGNSNSTDSTTTNSSTSSGASALGNILGGILQTDDLEVADIAGKWTATGPAIQFKSDNFLQQAGGAAAATAVEEKIRPYYEKLGLDGMTLEITSDGNVTATLKSGKSFKGTIKKGENTSEMVISFSKLSIGNVTVEVTKSVSTLSLMADISKLKSLLTAVADKLNMEQLSTITNLLENYDGIYAGLKLSK